MKTILVPTDYSENSEHAIRYALELNKKLNAKIILLHSYMLPVMATDIPITVDDNEVLRKDTLGALNKLKEKFKKQYPETTIEVRATAGFTEDEINTSAKETQADLIVMGTHGAGGMSAALLGTNTARVIENTNTTVLAVPEHSAIKEIRKIVFALNYAENDFENVDQVIAFAKLFNAEVELLHISTGSLDKTFEYNSIDHFKDRIREESKYDKINFKLLENKDALEGINFYLEEIKADMIAMTTRHRNLFQKFFGKSMTKKMAYHTHIPLMAFHEGE